MEDDNENSDEELAPMVDGLSGTLCIIILVSMVFIFSGMKTAETYINYGELNFEKIQIDIPNKRLYFKGGIHLSNNDISLIKNEISKNKSNKIIISGYINDKVSHSKEKNTYNLLYMASIIKNLGIDKEIVLKKEQVNIAPVGTHAFIGITNNMYYLGLFFYAATFVACFLLQSVREMVQQCLLLAPEISYTMIGIYIYPLIIFLFHRLFNRNKQSHYILLSNQTKLSASVTVSLGLIGTFIGLTGMITAISASLGGDGDISEKMNAMISSISLALNSMSFAFLTSILGVSISVLLLVSLNFFHFFYQKETKKTKQHASANYSEELNRIQETLNTLQSVNIGMAQKMISVTDNNELAADISSHLSALSITTQDHLAVLQSIKEADDDWKRKLAIYLLEEKINKRNDNEKISEEILKIDQTTQWLKENTIESRKKLLTVLSME